VTPKLSYLSKEMQKKFAEEKRRVQNESRQTGNSGAYYPKFIDMCESHTDEWLTGTYQVYCDVWATQGKEKSAAFIRTVFEKGLTPVIAVRRSTIFGELRLHSVRTRKGQNSTAAGELTRRLQKLQADWKTKLEIDAIECRHPKRPTDSAVKEIRSKRPGRAPRLPSNFIAVAGGAWLAERQSGQARVTHERLRRIALQLDEQGYHPPANYLEKICAEELRSYNSRNSTSKAGPIKTWIRLVDNSDKDHLRGMRRLLSRCAKKFDAGRT
jgi:hypothetical protein